MCIRDRYTAPVISKAGDDVWYGASFDFDGHENQRMLRTKHHLPVSYTHLDVYKRQVKYNAQPFWIERIYKTDIRRIYLVKFTFFNHGTS